MTAEPTDLDAVAERLEKFSHALQVHPVSRAMSVAFAPRREGQRLTPPLERDRECAKSLRIAANCVRIVAAIREPSPTLVDAVSLAMRQSPAWAAVFGTGTSDMLARAALRAIDERGAG